MCTLDMNIIIPTSSHVEYFNVLFLGSDCIGDSVVAGDTRWGGSYGVNVDYVARRYGC